MFTAPLHSIPASFGGVNLNLRNRQFGVPVARQFRHRPMHPGTASRSR